MSARKDLTGKKFGMLTAIKADYSGKRTRWVCLCDCGGVTAVSLGSLMSGRTRSCGCLRRQSAAKNGRINRTHGETKTRLWTIWSGMKARCRKHKAYTGISVSPEWANDYPAFREWALSHGYRDNLTIDRIDVYGDYTPDNCRWTTYKVQENNRTNNRRVEYHGERMTVSQLSDVLGIEYATLLGRINSGWPEDDLGMPPNLNNKNIRRGYTNA